LGDLTKDALAEFDPEKEEDKKDLKDLLARKPGAVEWRNLLAKLRKLRNGL